MSGVVRHAHSSHALLSGQDRRSMCQDRTRIAHLRAVAGAETRFSLTFGGCGGRNFLLRRVACFSSLFDESGGRVPLSLLPFFAWHRCCRWRAQAGRRGGENPAQPILEILKEETRWTRLDGRSVSRSSSSSPWWGRAGLSREPSSSRTREAEPPSSSLPPRPSPANRPTGRPRRMSSTTGRIFSSCKARSRDGSSLFSRE